VASAGQLLIAVSDVFSYILRRILIAVPTLLIFSFAMFTVLFQAGDPVASLRGGRPLDPETVAAILEENGFNDPFLVQYWNWLTGFFTGDWGVSFKDQAPAFEEITGKLGATIELLGVALIVTLLIAVPVGILGATRRYSTFDNVSTGFAYMGFATPTFFVGLLLQLMTVSLTRNGWGQIIFGVGVLLSVGGVVFFLRDHGRWIGIAAGVGVALLGAIFWGVNQGEALFFTGKRFTPFIDSQAIFTVDHLQHLVLPVATITVITIATWSRYLRSTMLDVLSQDYLRTARAKGLSERAVIYRHALRNATLPLITIMAIDAASFFQGAVVTETVFSWDGIGSRLVQAVREQDIPIAMGIVMIGALMVVIFNILADVAYSVADPRIRLS